jgi:hypothetical protein
MGLANLDPFASECGVSGSHGSRCGELGDRDVIRMPVSALGPERHDDLGMDSSNMPNNRANSFAWVCAIEILIAEIEQSDFTYT